jgi:hypothetical protein
MTLRDDIYQDDIKAIMRLIPEPGKGDEFDESP